MGLIQQEFPEPDPAKFFENLGHVGEIKLSQSAATLVCQQAESRLIWLLGVDVGILDHEGKYTEDFNEGWATKAGMMQTSEREQLEFGVTAKTALQRNNLLAAQAIRQVPSQFNAFILTAKSVRISDADERCCTDK